MVLRLGKQGAAPATAPAPVVAAAAAHQGNGATRPQPKGWGAPATTEAVDATPRPSFGQRSNDVVLEQRAAVTAKLTQRPAPDEVEMKAAAYAAELAQLEEAPAAVRAAAQFSPQVRQMLEAPQGETNAVPDPAVDKPKRTRAPRQPTVEQVTPLANAPWIDNRSKALEAAIAYCQHVDRDADTLEVAKLFLDFLNGVE